MTLALTIARAQTAQAADLIARDLDELIEDHFANPQLTWHGWIITNLEQTPAIDRWLTDLEGAYKP